MEAGKKKAASYNVVILLHKNMIKASALVFILRCCKSVTTRTVQDFLKTGNSVFSNKIAIWSLKKVNFL